MKQKIAGKKILIGALLASIISPHPILAEENVPVPVPAARKDIKAPKLPKKANTKPRAYQSACPAVLDGTIKAKILPQISAGQCGERSPLEVKSLAGIPLNAKAILNCRMATSLASWAEEAKDVAESILTDEIKSITISTSYDCRQRRGGNETKQSEHSFVNALDIIGFKLKKNKSITVLEHWESTQQVDDPTNENKKAAFLSSVRDAACTRFTTVLSPDTNEAHRDHFHFDLSCHGKNCTYKICE